MFEGTLELPVPIGTRGGAVQSHPTVKYTHQLMQNPDCSTLGGVLVSVGLAQNFAALRAMASEGIQRGHMSLHSKNIAIQANVPHEHVGDVSTFLVASGVITNQAAQDYLYALNILKKYSKENTRKYVECVLQVLMLSALLWFLLLQPLLPVYTHRLR